MTTVVKRNRIRNVRESGVHGVAMIREILMSDDIKGTSQELIKITGA